MLLPTRLQALSRWLSRFCLLLMITMPIGAVLTWTLLWGELGQPFAVRAGVREELIPVALTPVQQAAGAFVTLVPTGLLVYGLMWLRRLFAAFAAGQVFSADNARAIRVFAWSIIGLHIAQIFTLGLSSIIITMLNPPGQRVLAFGLSSDQVLALFVGLVFVLIAHVLEEGRRIADDNAAIV
ncbi:MAG: DUF2975 domain-containing protein [Rhodospirillaceae bacterium]|nr:DUF2975 domain-containing protein [Rhodospirillaceae bacterium]